MSLSPAIPGQVVPFTDEEIAAAVMGQPLADKRCGKCGLRKDAITADDLKEFPAHFTEKERRVIVLLCSGMCNKEIAARIETSEQVVKNCFRAAFQKVGCRDRASLLIRMMKFKYEGV